MMPSSSDAVILATARTPIARSFTGALKDIDAFDLGELVVSEVVGRSGLAPSEVNELVLGESLQGGGNIARNVAIRLGLTDVPGLSVNRHCASGLSAVELAARAVQFGSAEVVVAGGTESLSTSPTLMRPAEPGGEPEQWFPPTHPETPGAPHLDVIMTVGENTARAMNLTRRDVDEWAAYSHNQAIQAADAAAFSDEIVPVRYRDRDGLPQVFSTDENPRRGVTVATLAKLSPLRPDIERPTVTAMNAAGINDAAAAVVVTSRAYADTHGLPPLARILASADVGIDPALTGLAPTLAIPKVLATAGLDIADIDVFEINEAFCSVPVAAVRELRLDPNRVNVNGSGCSLGHPIACTGTRMLVTMIHELRRRDAQHGLIAMCAGGGMGSAMIIEAL